MQAYAGAKSVLGIDASQLAVDQATENAKLNGLQEVVKFQCEDVFALLPRLEAEGRKFDVIILDPPAFTKSRSSVKNAVKGYREINLRAMKLLKDGGFWQPAPARISWTYELFTQTIGQAAKNVHKRLRQVELSPSGTRSSDSLGGRGILLSEILYFSGYESALMRR